MTKADPLSVVLDHDECVRLFGSQQVARLCVLYLTVTQFTGRRLESAEDEWAFEKGAYL